jgi:dolichyl-phosphate-mannose--protein O-mannosyl transferase
MGKNFIAMSVAVLGMTPFAWRLPGTLLGVLMVPLLYAFARYLFRSNKWAMIAATVFAFDFMRFTQTRLATIDTYVTFFVLAMYFCMYLYVKRRSLPMLALCGVMMGLAIASKWQGVYGALGLPFLFFPALYRLYQENAKKAIITFFSCFAFFIVIPLIIYTLSYIPFILAQGGGLRAAWDNQQHMFNYHADLVAEHGFASPWWSWPIMQRPMWLYVNRSHAEGTAGMSSFGNPAIWWVGILIVITAFITLVRDKILARKADYIPIFLLVAIAAQYLPWAMVSRLTFIYHFFPSVPFLVLLIIWVFKRYIKNYKIAMGYAVLVIGLFILFYPVLAGIPVNPEWVRRYLVWLPGWVFM